MATWNTRPVDGNKNLPDNRVLINDDFELIETYQVKDHFWIDGTANKNGRHRQVSMVTTDPINTDISIPADTEGVSYVKEIDTVASKYILHHRGKDDDIVRPLSMGTVWAYVVFNPKTISDISAPSTSGFIINRNIKDAGFDSTDNSFKFTFYVNAPPNATTATLGDYMIHGSSTRQVAPSGGTVESVTTYDLDGTSSLVGSFKIFFTGGSTIRSQTQIKTTKAHIMVLL